MHITRTSAACERERFSEYDVVDGTGRAYIVTHRPTARNPHKWEVNIRVEPKNGRRGYWRTIRNGRILSAVQHYEHSLSGM